MAGIQIIAKDKNGNIKQEYETPSRGKAISVPVPEVKPKVVKPAKKVK
jgi:hypothetical protein